MADTREPGGVVRSYLAEVLGMPWDRVHNEAEVLEHYISEELEERIAHALGDPRHDPHGDPIPNAQLDLADDHTVRLCDLEPGAVASFARVSDSDPEMLRYLDERGIRPGSELEVTGRDPFEGPLHVTVAGIEHVLGERLAGAIRVVSGT